MKKIWLIIILSGIVLITVTLITLRVKENNALDSFYSIQDEMDEMSDSYFDEESMELLYAEEWESIPRARVLDSVSSELELYISFLKDEMLDSFGSEDYEKADESRFLDSLFFNGESVSETGNEFLSKMNPFRNSISDNFKTDFPEIVAEVEKEFSTGPVTQVDGEQQDWLRFNYYGFPLVASLSKMTQLQVDIKNVKDEIFDGILEDEY
jgi:hypothetical protein